ncbi:hypothetical protein D3C83_191650 [compost metagenome]
MECLLALVENIFFRFFERVDLVGRKRYGFGGDAVERPAAGDSIEVQAAGDVELEQL